MKMIKNQENHLEDMEMITGKMKEDNRIISEELANQHQIIAELDKQISK